MVYPRLLSLQQQDVKAANVDRKDISLSLAYMGRPSSYENRPSAMLLVLCLSTLAEGLCFLRTLLQGGQGERHTHDRLRGSREEWGQACSRYFDIMGMLFVIRKV